MQMHFMNITTHIDDSKDFFESVTEAISNIRTNIEKSKADVEE